MLFRSESVQVSCLQWSRAPRVIQNDAQLGQEGVLKSFWGYIKSARHWSNGEGEDQHNREDQTPFHCSQDEEIWAHR